MADLPDRIRAVLTEHGITDEYGESIHSWRCQHPQVYGPCSHVDELVRDLSNLLDTSTPDCNCGWGGVHDPDNPNCQANESRKD